jgi:hypothetical protein
VSSGRTGPPRRLREREIPEDRVNSINTGDVKPKVLYVTPLPGRETRFIPSVLHEVLHDQPSNMAAQTDGENFSDDDLDDLPLAALDELENHAIRLTQAAQTRTQGRREAPPSSDYGDDFDDEDLDDAVVIDEARSAPAIVPALHRASLSQTSQREHQFLRPQFGGTSTADGPRHNARLQHLDRDHLPGPAGSRPNLAVPTPQGSQAQAQAQEPAQRMGEAAILRKQLEDVRPWY